LGLSGVGFSAKWLRGLDLNQRPLGYEPNELPGCSTPQIQFINCHHLGQITLYSDTTCAEKSRQLSCLGQTTASAKGIALFFCVNGQARSVKTKAAL
jgi:hypothetical protein